MPPTIRPGRDSDGPALIDLIWSCWSQYPGIKLDVDGELPQLRSLATFYAGLNGALWVAESDGGIVGMIATHPIDPATWEMCQVYVSPWLHGSGLGAALLGTAERHANETGAERLVLWTDTRFDRAHRFYEKHSYVRRGPVRVLHDISNSLEYAYAKPVNGVESLDIAAANAAIPRLVDILCACVADGASVNFLAPLAADTARQFWQRAASQVGLGDRVIVVGWRDGVLLATATLDLGTPENQRHRADVQKLLVHPHARRLGLGRAIMRALEAEAQAHGRSLLTLVTRSDDPSEALYRSEGWIESGRIPDFARGPGTTPHEAVFFWKRVAIRIAGGEPERHISSGPDAGT